MVKISRRRQKNNVMLALTGARTSGVTKKGDSSSTQKQAEDNDLSIFDNPMTRLASSQLTEEQKEMYKSWGRYLFNGDNFTLENFDEKGQEKSISDSIKYIVMALKSGLIPKDLEDDEKLFMESIHGQEWYKFYGYTDEDL